MRVLLVEDNPLNQMVARALLESGAAVVTVADNGEQALAILRVDAGYDLVLMDVQMPVLDGLATTRLIRSELGLNLPVVAMSAGAHARERDQCSAAGMSGFLAKPLDAALLQALLRHTAAASAGAAGMLAEVFDVAALYALNELNAQRRKDLRAMIARTLAAAEPQLDAARAAWERGATDAAARELHDLRGALGTLGATRFARLSVRIEEALCGNAGGDLAAMFAEAGMEVRHTVQCASAWLAACAAQD